VRQRRDDGVKAVQRASHPSPPASDVIRDASSVGVLLVTPIQPFDATLGRLLGYADFPAAVTPTSARKVISSARKSAPPPQAWAREMLPIGRGPEVGVAR